MSRYQNDFRRSLSDPAGFWGEAARALHWDQPPTQVLDGSRAPLYRWFAPTVPADDIAGEPRYDDVGRASCHIIDLY